MALKLIVVDDDEVDRYLLRRTVRRWNPKAVVEEIGSAQAALDTWRSGALDATDEASGPPVILIDINMPEMSGLELLDRLGELPAVARATPVVAMLTSSANARDQARAEETDLISAFIVKPLTAADLDALADLSARRVDPDQPPS